MTRTRDLWPNSEKNALVIITARGISDFGTFLNIVALSTYVYLLNEQVMHVSIFFASRVMGGICASLAGTPFFSRFNGKWSLIWFDLLRALLLMSLLIVSKDMHLYILPGIGFGIGLGSHMFSIGINTQIPHLIHPSQRASTNAWLSSISSMSSVLGSLVAGLIVSIGGYDVIFLLTISTYLLAGIVIWSMKSAKKSGNQAGKVQYEWKHLFQILRKKRVLVFILFITMADTLGSAAHNVGFPIISKLITPDTASKAMGLILATWAFGKFSGARLTGVLLRNQNYLVMERFFMLGVLLMSTGFIFLFNQDSLYWTIPYAIWAGVGDGISEVSLLSRIQEEPDDIRLPVFSLLTFFQMTGFGIGMILVAPFFVWWPPVYVVLLFHGIPIGMIIIVFFSMFQYWTKTYLNN